ncbi:MAG TPA: hypothetical protein V6D17_20225 [Candidatus Obscuribacterales bacterium]
MKRAILTALIALLSFCGCGAKGSLSPSAGDPRPWPTKAFTATYDMTTGSFTVQQRWISDGKGHLRLEMTDPSSQSVIATIIDYPNKKALSLHGAQKMAFAVPWDRQDGALYINETTAAEFNAQPLGTKVIAGHPCHGWKYSKNGIESEVWLGDDTGCYVESSGTTPQGMHTKLTLREYSDAVPPDSLFSIPPDFKTMAGYTSAPAR